LEIADLARRVKNFEVRKLPFELSMSEAKTILGEQGSPELPFLVSDQIKSLFKE